MQRYAIKRQSLGVSRIAGISAGFKIETQPMPIPSALAVSHMAWMAATAE